MPSFPGKTIIESGGQKFALSPQAARCFTAHHPRFSAEDIQVELIYHNMGRRDIGLRSLYYVIYTHLAQQALCATPSMTNGRWRLAR